jgi:eukaryotic-like serine/threonine-protein kinase
MMETQNDIPAHKLEGLTVNNGWQVKAKHVGVDGKNGGKYSVCYAVERDGQKGFLKAIDYSRALREPNPPRAMLELAQAFEFERNVLHDCAAHHMDRVIAPLEDGEVKVDESLLGRVNYLIFEMADGDIRKTLAAIERYELTLRLRALHHVATGMYQLHKAGIAHQDLKPSNVLTFGSISKVSDLGSVCVKGRPGPRDQELCAGTPSYAPPEQLYGLYDAEFNVRRFGGDLYLLGSMVTFVFSGLGMTASLLGYMTPDLRPDKWAGTYAAVLPYIRDAFGHAVRNFSEQITHARLRSDLTEVVQQLCEPDPALRGNPLNRQGFGNWHSLERYVSKFDLLACRSATGLFDAEN